MSTQTPPGFDCQEAMQPVRDAMQPLEDRRERARVVASFAEYLAEYVHDDRQRALEAMAALAEWCDGDPALLAQARADVCRDTRRAARRTTGRAHTAVVQTNHDAVELLELVARAS
jgi:hypothetical protein